MAVAAAALFFKSACCVANLEKTASHLRLGGFCTHMSAHMFFLQKYNFLQAVGSAPHCRRGLCALVLFVGTLLLGGCANSGEYSMLPQARDDIPGVGNPAGVVFYAQTPEGVYLLLADHTFPIRRGWGDFGGAADAGETIAQTAAREAEEETRGIFKREMILEAIAGQTPVFSRGYAFYFVEVEKVPAEDIGNYPVSGIKIAYRERGPYAWVPYSEIEPYLEGDGWEAARNSTVTSEYLAGSWWNTNWFWPMLLSNLRAAKAADAIPWEQSVN